MGPRHYANLPNALSASRILLVPLLVVVLLTRFEGKELVALGVFLLAALTDVLDGFIARRWKMETRLGKLLDPAADKILTGAALISLVELGAAPAWMVVVIIARELGVSALRSFAAAERVVIGASVAGKLKTFTQIVAISLLIFFEKLGDLVVLADVALWIALIVTIYSGAEYYVRYGRMLLMREPPPSLP